MKTKTIEVRISLAMSIVAGFLIALIPFLSGLVVGAGIEKKGATIELRQRITDAINSGKAQRVDDFFIARGVSSKKTGPVHYIWLAEKKKAASPVLIAGAGDEGFRGVIGGH